MRAIMTARVLAALLLLSGLTGGGAGWRNLAAAYGSAVPPVIVAVLPQTIAVADYSQTLTVQGTGFQPGLSVKMTPPLGIGTVTEAVTVHSVTATAFQLTTVITRAGVWRLQVTNPDGGRSDAFTFAVQAAAAAAPRVTFAFLSSPGASSSPQPVTVLGANFRPGLTVTAISPGGSTFAVGGPSITGLREDCFDAELLINEPGIWSIVVTNPDGQQSRPSSFDVGIGTLLHIDRVAFSGGPSSVPQTVTVTGNSFQRGLAFTLVPPGGAPYTLSGNAIYRLSATSIEVDVVIDLYGTWSFWVVNPDGQRSNTFTLNYSGIAPSIAAGGIANVANFMRGAVAPGELIALRCWGISVNPGVANSGIDPITGLLPAALANVRITFDGVAAPLFYVSSVQINLQVPYEVAGKSSTKVVVSRFGLPSESVAVPVLAAHPGAFTYQGNAVITNAVTGEWISAETPAARGSYITLWISGAGVTNPPVATGAPAPATPLSYAIDPHAWLDGLEIEVAFAGLTPGMVGLTQVNLRIPEDAPVGPAVPLRLTLNGTDVTGSSNSPITVAIQ